MKEQQPPMNVAAPDDHGHWAQARQKLQAIGFDSGPAVDLSFLNVPDPFMVQGGEVRRGRKRRRPLPTDAPPAATCYQEPPALPPIPAEAATPPAVPMPAPAPNDAPAEPCCQEPPAPPMAAEAATPPAAPMPTPGPISDVDQFMKLAGSFLGMAGPDLKQTISRMASAGMAAALAEIMPAGPPGNVYQAVLNEPDQKTGQVNTEEMTRIVSDHAATIFDGRTLLEYAIGHIPGALSLAPKPGAPKSKHVGDVEEIERIVPNRQAPIIVYCNGPFCGKSRRLGEELVKAGYTNVRRYQLGTPVWRALVGPMEIEPEGIRYVLKGDQTAAFLDARTPQDFAAGSLAGARNVQVGDIAAAKSDGRLPMDDFNTRVVSFGQTGTQALALAEALAHTGFNNVKFYDGTFASLLMAMH